MRAFLIAVSCLCLLAPDASAAARKYRVSEISVGNPVLGWMASSSTPEKTIRDLQTSTTILVMVSGPPEGQAVRRLQVRLTGVSCPEHCTSRSWSLKLKGGITKTGRAGRTMRSPRWGCGKPVIRARVLLKDGSHSPWFRWQPKTIC